MVDIIIGSISPPGMPVNKPGSGGTLMEAELLHIREPRQRAIGPAGQERRKQARQDPPYSRVLTILIPDGRHLPKDLDGKRYKVLLRFQKK